MTVLFVLATIVFFLSVDWIVRRAQERRADPLHSLISASPRRPYPVRAPEGIFFAPSHTWLNLFPSGKIRLGIDDFISRLLQQPEIIMLKQTGDQVQKGEPIILLKEADHLLTVRSPIACDILAVNEELPKNPSLLKERLFSDGWGYMMKPKKSSEVKQFFIGNETRTWLQAEFQRLRDLLAGIGRDGVLQPAYLQEGGPPIAGVLSTMDDAVWQQLDSEFLRVQ